MVICAHREDRAQLWAHLERDKTEHVVPSWESKPPVSPLRYNSEAAFRVASVAGLLLVCGFLFFSILYTPITLTISPFS